MEGLGVIALDARLFPATSMPQSQHFERFVADAVVEEVADAAEKQTPHARRARSLVLGADARLLRKKRDGLTYVFCDRSRRGRSVLLPPLGSPARLQCRTRGDLDAQCHARGLLRQLGQQLLERYELTALNLGHCSKKLFFLCGRQAERFIRPACEHRYESPFPQGNSLDYDLAVDDGASCDLHDRYGTPQEHRPSGHDAQNE
jgi:hypothetical protein